MRIVPSLLLLAIVSLAGCTAIFGGPQVVEDECVEATPGLISCDVVVENPADEPMTVEVTVEIGASGTGIFETRSETVEIDPGEREEVSIGVAGVGGDLRYGVDAEEVDG